MAKRILVADESQAVLRSVKVILGQEGYEVLGVTDGPSLTATVRSARPHLVLVDVELPPTDGYIACRAIKDDSVNRSVAVLLMVGTFVALDRPALEACRAEGFITKPVDPLALRARIREVLKDVEDTHRIALAQVTEVAKEPARATDAAAEVQDLVDAAEIQAEDLGDLADQDVTFPTEGEAAASEKAAVTRVAPIPDIPTSAPEPPAAAAPPAPEERRGVAPRLVAFVQKLRGRQIPADEEALTEEERRIIEDNEAMLRGVAPLAAKEARPEPEEETPEEETPAEGGDAGLASLVSDVEPIPVVEQPSAPVEAPAPGPSKEPFQDSAASPSLGGAVKLEEEESLFDLDAGAAALAEEEKHEDVRAIRAPAGEEKGADTAVFRAEVGSGVAAPPGAATIPGLPIAIPTEPVVGKVELPPAPTVDQALIDKVVEAVVRRMSDEVVREIAWEVVPELARLHVEQKVREQSGKS